MPRRPARATDRAAAFNRENLVRAGLRKRQAAQRLRQINQHIEAIDAALVALRDADPGLKLRFDILASIPGTGAATAFAMLIEMPEPGASRLNAWPPGSRRSRAIFPASVAASA